MEKVSVDNVVPILDYKSAGFATSIAALWRTDGIVMVWITKLAHEILLLLPKKMCPSGIDLPTSRVAYELILAEWHLSEFQHA